MSAHSGNVRFSAYRETPPPHVQYDLQTRSGNITVNGERVRANSAVSGSTLLDPIPTHAQFTIRATSGNIHLNYR